MNVAPTDSNVFKALRTFLVSVLPSSVDVIQAQVNRVPEPKVADFVVMTELRRQRIATNVDGAADVKFTASIAAAVMTVSDVAAGTIRAGATLSGTGVIAGTMVGAQTGGPPGGGTALNPGIYAVSPSQTVTSRTISSGAKTVTQETQVAIQLDIHGPASGDNAQVISTLMRDEFATASFADQSPNYGVTPLFADDPKQMPFLNSEQQYENRWIVESMLQVNPVVRVQQEFADSLAVDVISVDERFPS